MEEMNKTNEDDRAITSLKQPETSPIKIEEDVEFKSNLQCSMTNLNGGSKSRLHLTEAEKEARRLRRVLANRESARQTIRRRQAMFEELTRKAVDLQVENDNLKKLLIDEKDKELAKKEYEYLKSTNDCLKAQVDEMMRPEEESEEKSEPRSTYEPTPSFPYNLASTVPFYWPMMVQPSGASIEQRRSESGTATPLVPMMQLWKPDSFLDQGNSVVIANPGTLLCVLPFPRFFPFHSSSSAGHHQFSGLNEKQNDTSAIHQYNASASSEQMLNSESSLPLKVKTQVLNSAGSTSSEDPNQVGFGLPPDGSGEGGAIHQQGRVLLPAPLNCIRPVASIGPFTALHQSDTSNAEPVQPIGEHTSETVSDESRGETIRPCKKAADAIAAAEARKRRKELMKLKNVHAHQ